MSDILHKTENFVIDLLIKKLNPKYVYHNLWHTEQVVKSTKELLSFYDLGEEENESITLAAWLHDTGYTEGSENHEERSCKIARDFLEEQAYPTASIDKVCSYILATKRHYQPQNLPEKIMRDADCAHFSKPNFQEISELLRKELIAIEDREITPKKWREQNIKMLALEHEYNTDYAIENWKGEKDKNLQKLKKDKKTEKNIAKKERLKAKYKSDGPDRGIQTLYRVTLRNHITLSNIADTKANILLSVNAIIISLVLANLIPKLDNPHNYYLVYPTAIFVTFSVISMVLAIVATRPNVTQGKFTKEDVEQRKVNLLFFGNFHKMSLPDFEWAINELVKDKEYIYSSLTKDLYFLGLVLDRKYKILRLTYLIFMIGMILSVIAFGISFKYFGSLRV
ncbi:HD domain-containing protein [Arenibacter sp. 6A1]|uniref:Pycsar system effector family protein n=1 Tax=Arenibacter sp. 6A1 TaxID=2720391 RepID=UPI001445FB1E|nr:Pycsar system effector family protein [Arenibacter sp. 6A1]NKI26123.1 HD domain-containing protein [Arenibacter sp. 6A1]